jgi:hypothetical protein
VGRDFPGKLKTILGQNRRIDVVSYDSLKTRSGIRPVTIEKAGAERIPMSRDEEANAAQLLAELRQRAAALGHGRVEEFIAALPANYLNEEVNSFAVPRRRLARCLRHPEAALIDPGAAALAERVEAGL